MGEWVGGGRIKCREDVVEGRENAPAESIDDHLGARQRNS
jgi:NADPH-dependent curcumin reductase CurA